MDVGCSHSLEALLVLNARCTLIAVYILMLAFADVDAARAQVVPDVTDGLTSGTLFDELARMDSIMFDASFASCDATTVNAIFSDDVEFYHDLTGFASGEEVRENIRRLTGECPGDRGVTRSVIEGSVRVYPIKDYGAAQIGMHRFDERGADTSTVARFVHLWRLQDGAWRITRVLSLDHRTVPPVADPADIDAGSYLPRRE
jgi:hypothetical protein